MATFVVGVRDKERSERGLGERRFCEVVRDASARRVRAGNVAVGGGNVFGEKRIRHRGGQASNREGDNLRCPSEPQGKLNVQKGT